MELVEEGATFVTLSIVGLEIVGAVVSVAIVSGTFTLATKSLVSVVGAAAIAVAFSNFVSFAFDF